MNALLRIAGWVLAVALVVLPVVAVLNGWVGAGHWPLTRLQATGEFRRVDGALLRQTLAPYAQRGFFAVDLEGAQDAVSRLPWVESAEVRKRWPDVLEVRVVEHKPFAVWGTDRLLSEHGRLFPAKGIAVPKDLPQFFGPDARTRDVVELYNESRALFAKEVNRADYYHEFHFWLALASYQLGQYEEARAHLTRAMEASTSRNDRDLYAAKLAWLRTHGAR